MIPSKDIAAGAGRPFVSIIVPARNEQANIRGCLERLARQTYPKDRLEVLIVDGVSCDDTRRIVEQESKRLAGECGLKVRLLDNPKGQRTSAMNIGIKNAAGDVLVRIDARTIIASDYVDRCVTTLMTTGADNVGGVQCPVISEDAVNNRYSRCNLTEDSKPLGNDQLTIAAIGSAMAHPFGIGNARFRLGKTSGPVDTVYLGCFRKQVFEKVGLFDEQSPVISEDSEMNYLIRKSGGMVYLDKDIMAYYKPRDRFTELARLYFRYGGARAGFLVKHRKLTSWRQFVAPAFLAANVILPVAGLFYQPLLWFWAAVVALYLAADISVSAFLCFKPVMKLGSFSKVGLFARLLLAFPAIHVAWAGGFFARLLQRPEPGTYWGY